MRASRPSLRRVVMLSTVVTLSIFSASALAQDNNNDNKSGDNPPASSANTPAASSGNNRPSSTGAAASTTNRPASSAAPSSSGAPPRIDTTSSAAGNLPKPSNMPTATKTNDQIPEYPAASVPPTQNAPFMRHSTLPEGTVFICVGAILGAFGLAVLLWRGIVACLLHRSVERAALAQHAANDKASFPPPPAPFYKTEGRDSSPHLAGTAGRGQRRTTRGPIPSATPSQTNLFFSPTAGNANNAGMGTASTRDSRFLPSGFYAAGTSSPANGGHGHSISLSNLRPDSRGYSRAMGTTPPDSPALQPRTGPMPRSGNLSTSSVNLNVLNRPGSSRAPSAYLDDLLDEQPHLFPPGGPPSTHQSRHSGVSQMRRGS